MVSGVETRKNGYDLHLTIFLIVDIYVSLWEDGEDVVVDLHDLTAYGPALAYKLSPRCPKNLVSLLLFP